MSCLTSNTVTTSSAASSLSISLGAATNSGSPIDSLLSGIITNFPSPSSASIPINVGATAQSETPLNFFSDMLSAVTLEESQLCTNCAVGSPAFSKCMDCCELLCDSCVQAQQCGRLGKDHKVSRYPPNPISPPQTSAGSRTSSSGVSSSPSNVINSFCDHHRGAHRLFCQTCLAPLCTECLISDHSGHQFSYIEEAIDSARATNKKLSLETRTAILAVKEAIDRVQHTSDSVEAKSMKAAAEVTKYVRRYIAALKEREMDLLKHIDQARQIKGKLLRSQLENLRQALTKLSHTSEMLNESMDSSNSMEILTVNEQSSKQLKYVGSLKSEFTPCEDDGIMFLPPDNGFLRAISSFGNLTISPVSSNKMMKPAPLIQNILGIPTIQTGIFHALKNQTIHGANSVIAKDRRSRPSIVIGGQGHTEGLFFRPWGVCCDHLGNIVVADRGNNRIQIFNPQGIFLYAFGTEGYGPGEFRKPAGVAITPTGHLVIGDKDNHRIQVVQMDGTFIFSFGERGSDNGQFYYPWDVACNSQGHMVVSDTRNHRIQIFNSEGVFLNKYGFEGTTMWKHFDAPRGVSFTPKGNIIVTDFNNHRIVVIDGGLRNAQFLGEEGGYNKQFLRPQGVVCDDAGNIIVADSRNNRIQVFESNGNFLWKFGRAGEGPGEMDRPSGICLNPQGRIIVVDFGNHRVQVF